MSAAATNTMQSANSDSLDVLDPLVYRSVFSRIPTAVTAITGQDASGQPVGLIVGTFQSLSLDPPMVMFSVDRKSSTWPKVRRSNKFSASVLADDQIGVCDALAQRRENKFETVRWRLGPLGTPHIDGALVHIDCTISAEVAVGDHFMVVGLVTEMHERPGRALLFSSRTFGEFAPHSTAPAANGTSAS